ncbi:MAG: DUF4837 family protein [Balneolaceae bacterium]|nr:DUF4837 family protein [Balneolaceae bacterium]
MKKISYLLLVLLPAAFLISCDGDYRREAQGQFGNVVVVMDSTKMDSETANAIRSTFGGKIEYFLGFEPRFDLSFRDFATNEELEEIKFNKNIIIASPIDAESNVGSLVRAMLADDVEQSVRAGDSFAFPLQNKWYRNQWTLILTSSSDSALATKIRRGEENLVNSLIDKELARWKEEIYERGEKYAIEDSLMTNHGWKIRVQHDYYTHLDTSYTSNNGETNYFYTLQRQLPNNDRRFWAWWKEDVTNINYLDQDWINAKRDSLWKKWIRGSRDSSYVTTEYRISPRTRSFRYSGDLAYETLGWWRMTEDAMGGPFVNLTVYDDETQRLFMMGFVQFAPKYSKRRFVRQFRAMLRTFESDSTWNQPNLASK